MSVQSCFILMIAGTAVCMDFLMERVVNSFICLGLMSGLCLQLWQSGLKGIPVYLLGLLIPFGVLFPLFYFRMLGAGDIKLFVVLGGFLGYPEILNLIFCSFLLGAVLSLAFLISCGNFKERLSYLLHYLYQFYVTGKPYSYIQKGHRAENFHFTVPILLSVMLYAGGFY